MNRRGYRKCPACAEWIRKEAAICRFCRAILTKGPLPAFAPPEAITPEASGEPASTTASSRSALFRGIDHRFANHNVQLSTRQREAIVAFLNESRNQFCEATVLFMDVKGFTTLVQNAKTEEVEQFLHAYYSIFVSTVEFYNGFVVEFQGDGGHAVFGAPRAYERDAEAAVRAALDIRERIRVLPPVDGYKIQVSCGLATGRVLSSIIHLPTETHYKIYGHAVNLSARVQSAAQPDTVLTDPGTHSLTENRFDFEVLPKRQFKNVAKPIHTYRVKGIRSHPEFAPTLIPFVGREAELHSLREAWSQFQRESQAGVPEPRHRGAFIKGPAGIGKTRLAWEFAGSMLERGRILGVGRAPHETRIPWGLWRAVVAASWKGNDADAEETIRKELNQQLDHLAIPGKDRNAYYFLFGLPEGIKALASLSPKIQRRLVVSCLHAFLERLAGGKPLLLLLDDLQWSDPSSLEILEALLADDWPGGVFFLLLVRQDSDLKKGPLGRLKRIHVRALDTIAGRALANALSATTDYLTEVREAIAARGEGNPFYIVELFKMLAELRREKENLPGATTTITVAELRDKVPPSLTGLLQARLDRLDRHRRDVLQCGAVLGRRFAFQLLDLFEQIREGLLAKLYSLRSLEYLDDIPAPEGLEFLFRHNLLRDVTYGSLPERQRRALHGEIARQMEKHFPERSQEDLCPLLAYHYDHSDYDEKAVEYHERAGERARTLGGVTEALGHFEAGLARLAQMPRGRETDTRQARLLLQKAGSLYFAGELEAERKVLAECAAIARKRGMAALETKVHYVLGRALIQAGDYKNAQKELESALRKAIRLADQSLLAQIANSRGILEWHRANFKKADTWYAKAVEYGIEKTDPDSAADIHSNRGLIEWKTGRLDKARQCFQHALRLQAKTGNRFGEAITRMNLGIMQENLGRFEQAAKTYRDTLQLAETIHYMPVITASHANLGNLYIVLGNAAQALDHSARSAEAAERSRDPRGHAIALENLALSHLMHEAFDEALRAESQARRIAEQLEDNERLLSLDLVLVELFVQRKQFQRAQTLLHRADEIIRKQAYRSEWPRFWRLSAMLARESGRVREAAVACRKGLREAEKQRNRPEEIRLRRVAETLGK